MPYRPKTARFWGQPIVEKPFLRKISNEIFDRFKNQKSFNVFDLSGKYNESFVKKIDIFNPEYIHGYASSILDFSYFLSDFENHNIRPLAVSTTAEPLSNSWKKRISAAFDSPVYDQYGCGECNSIAFQYESESDLIINKEHALVRTEKSKKRGRIVLTNLDNFAMPFINYVNDDIVELDNGTYSDAEKIKKIEGRSGDFVTDVNGKKLQSRVFYTFVE